MPTYLLIGIPVIVGILLFAILSLPDEDMPENEHSQEKKKGKKK